MQKTKKPSCSLSDKYFDLVRYFGAKSWVGSTIVAGSAIVGLMITLYQDEISGAFPFPLLNFEFDFSNSISMPAVVFWVLFLATVWLAWAKERTKNIEEAMLHAQLSEKISEVREITLTMPPKSYLEFYSLVYVKASNEVDRLLFAIDEIYPMMSVKDSASSEGLGTARISEEYELLREDTNRAIRVVLDAILQLSVTFDSSFVKSDVKFYSGITWLIPVSEIDSKDYNIVWDLSRDLSRHSSKEGWLSKVDILFLDDVNLTTDSKTDAAAIGYKFQPVGLGWEDDYYNKDGVHLKGPLTSYNNSYFSKVNSSEIYDQDLSEYSPKSISRVSDFYKNDEVRKSFVSISVRGIREDSQYVETIAVLNIYKSHGEIFKDGERASMFYWQITPFIGLLFKLLLQRLEQDIADGRRVSLYTMATAHPEEGE